MISNISQPVAATASLPSAEERERQKDKLLTDLHAAIKQVQLRGCSQTTPLTLQDEPLRQLLRCIDQALLHGLRHLANGYWLFVREFSHNQLVELLQSSKYLHTNLGKGRAWLYLALNEASLESYIRSFTGEQKLVNKYYIGQAFVRDEQRMEMLTTMVAGLEYTSFQLDLDASYLNHSILPLTTAELVLWQNEESPLLSPTWPKTFLSQALKLPLDLYMTYAQFSSFFPKNHKTSSMPTLDSPSAMPSQDSGFATMENSQIQYSEPSENDSAKNEGTLGEKLFQAVNNKCANVEITDEDVTVVRVRNKVKRRKKPPDRSSSSTSVNGIEQQSANKSETRPDEGTKNEERQATVALIKQILEETIESSVMDHLAVPDSANEDAEQNVDNVNGRISPPMESVANMEESSVGSLNPEDATVQSPDLQVSEKDVTSAQIIDDQPSPMEIKPAIKLRNGSGNSENKNPAKRVSFEIDLLTNDFSVDPEMRGSPEGEEAPSMFSSTPNLKESLTSATKPGSSPKQTAFEVLPKLEPSEACRQAQQFNEAMNTEMKQAQVTNADSENIKVDNNTLLRLMLDVFAEEEQLYKMYHASVGHTENEMLFLFPVLTNKHVYMLLHQTGTSEFYMAMRISYTEIDYLLLGLNYQTVLIVCKRRRKRYAICTGDENLTRSIVASLEIAIRRWYPNVVLPSVFTDNMMQMIGMQKFIAALTDTERHEVIVSHYALVHWEDPEAPSTPYCPAGPSRKGYLMYRYCAKASSHAKDDDNWTPGYFVLRAGVLYRFPSKDRNDLDWYVRLHGNDVVGCKRSSSRKRPHVFELQMNDGSWWEMAAPNEYDASDWLQAFLQTVSHEMLIDDDRQFAVRSCCLVVASQKLFICQEDLEMFMFTPLGNANISDLNAVRLDKKVPSYCIMEFESVEAGISAGDWIVYFASEPELRKFLHVLEQIWKELLQVPLPIRDVEDESALEKCAERADILLKSWKDAYNVLQEPAAIVRFCPSPQ